METTEEPAKSLRQKNRLAKPRVLKDWSQSLSDAALR
jgi:hypothetical protein